MVSNDIIFRPATPNDCDVILHHRRGMFRDMGKGTKRELDAMTEVTAPWLATALADGSYRGFLAEGKNGRVVAGGGVLIGYCPARPGDLNIRNAVIVNVFTEPEFRRRGLARQLMLLIIQWLKDQGFLSVVLQASDDGQHLYESMGFVPTSEMRLWLGKPGETQA
jgi:GNAT superfamily N-acetyltransferase